MAEDQDQLNLPVPTTGNIVQVAANAPQFIKDAMALIYNGEHKAAAELMIAAHTRALPDGHPSKDGPSGIMLGETVSQFSQFEDQKQNFYEGTRFIAMMRSFEDQPLDFYNGVMFYLTQQRPDLLTGFTEYMEQVLANKVRIAAGEEAIAPSQSPRPI